MGYKSLEYRMKPTVYGVGCLGGNLDLKSKINGKLCKIHNLWRKMIERCYSEKVHERCPTYTGCYVSDEFKDYSKWREWYDNYQYKQDDWQLDKDLLIKGNKIYSEETCVFLPREINVALTKSNKTRGDKLIGVCFNKQYKKFESRVSLGACNQQSLGYYDNEYDAYLAYKEAKEAYLKELADKYKDILDPIAYEALYNYTVDIDD